MNSNNWLRERTLICKKSQRSRATGILMASPQSSRKTVIRISPPHRRMFSRRPAQMQYRRLRLTRHRAWAANSQTIVPICKSSKWLLKLTKTFSTRCQRSKMRSNSHQNRQRIQRRRQNQCQTSEHHWNQLNQMRLISKKRCPKIHQWLKT